MFPSDCLQKCLLLAVLLLLLLLLLLLPGQLQQRPLLCSTGVAV
jgi:hypothetical protein